MRQFLILISALLLGLSASAAVASKAQVVDNAAFFSADAIDKANKHLSDLDDKYGKQMRIESFPEIPADRKAKYTEANKRQFMQDWARSLAEQEKINGVFVLICKNPSTLQVEVGGDTLRSGAITQADRKAIADALLNAFKQKDYDTGLSNGVDAFSAALAAHAGNKTPPAPAVAPPVSAPPQSSDNPRASAPPQSSSSSSSSSPPPPYNIPANTTPQRSFNFGALIFLVAIIVIGAMLLRKLFGIGSSSSAYRGPTNYGAGPYPQQGYGGGGGFGRGFGGGLLGGLFGSWVGNRVFNQRDDSSTHHAPPADSGSSSSSGGTFNEAPPTDFSSGGGDTSGGGGDFGGGGGGGGGDFSGGGGGDASSGGGDF